MSETTSYIEYRGYRLDPVQLEPSWRAHISPGPRFLRTQPDHVLAPTKRRRLRKHGLVWIITFGEDEGVMGWTRVGLRPRWLQSCPLTPAAATEQEPVRRRDREAPPQSQFLQYACGADYCAMLRSWQMSCELNRVRCDCCRLDPVLSCLR